jgi:hypothetical protein
MLLNETEAREKLEQNGLQMKYIVYQKINDEIIENYMNKYKDWKTNDKVKLKFNSKEEFLSSLKESEIREYMPLLDKDEWDIEYFYNVGAMILKDFDYGVEMDWFVKVL